MFLRLRPWAQAGLIVLAYVAIAAGIPLVIYQMEHSKTAQAETLHTVPESVVAQPVVRNGGKELMSVSSKGDLTVVGDLVVRGKINGIEKLDVNGYCPVYAPSEVVCKVEPVTCKVETVATTAWTALFMGVTGALVMLVGLKVFDRLG